MTIQSLAPPHSPQIVALLFRQFSFNAGRRLIQANLLPSGVFRQRFGTPPAANSLRSQAGINFAAARMAFDMSRTGGKALPNIAPQSTEPNNYANHQAPPHDCCQNSLDGFQETERLVYVHAPNHTTLTLPVELPACSGVQPYSLKVEAR